MASEAIGSISLNAVPPPADPPESERAPDEPAPASEPAPLPAYEGTVIDTTA
jgi:hypothetical protein